MSISSFGYWLCPIAGVNHIISFTLIFANELFSDTTLQFSVKLD